MPDPVYRAVVEHRKVPPKPYRRRSPVIEIEITVRRLANPLVRDAPAGSTIEIAPEIDQPRAWSEYRRRHPDRRYAISKRQLSNAELRRYGLRDDPLEERQPPRR
jgi:hypothetical protein